MKKEVYKPTHKNDFQLDLSKYPEYEKVSKAPTDEEIKISLYNNICGCNLNEVTQRQMSRLGISRNSACSLPDEDKIKIFDAFQAPLIPDEDEFIHRKDWAPLGSLVGCTHEILQHPVFKMANEYIVNNYTQNTETLIVCSCSKSKPYRRNTLYAPYRKISDIVVMSNSGIIPINDGNDFSYCYPFRYYNWDHMLEYETEGLLKAEEDFMYWSLYNLLKVTNYKKIAFIAYPVDYYPNYFNTMNRLMKDFPNIEFHYCPSDEEFNELLSIFKVADKAHRGLALQRIKSSRLIQNSVRRFLGLPELIEATKKKKLKPEVEPLE